MNCEALVQGVALIGSYVYTINHMYNFTKCVHANCLNIALSNPDEHGISVGHYCFTHTPNKDEITHKIIAYIADHEKIMSLNAAGLSFSGLDFSGKKFFGCNFQKCNFIDVFSKDIRVRMSFFDFSSFRHCTLFNANMQYTSFSGALLRNTAFNESDIVHNNFNGINAENCSFDDSDLYNSRFIKADIHHTNFKNCNIKKTIFYEALLDDVSFKSSNTREALFEAKLWGIL